MKRIRSLLLRLLLCGFYGMSASSAALPPEQDDGKIEWQSGKALSNELTRARSVTLKAVPVLKSLNDLQQSLRYAIVLDHRIDPDQPVTLATGMVRTSEAIRQIAASVDCGVSFTEQFAYVGPGAATDRLRTVIELRQKELRSLRSKLDREVSSAIFKSTGQGWPMLTQPEQLLNSLVAEVGLETGGDVTLPHDLWRAQPLPALDFCSRVMLILVQFDLTFDVTDGGQVQLVPLDANPVVTKRLRVPRERLEAVRQVLSATQSAEANWGRDRVTIEGRRETIDAVQAAIDGETEKIIAESLMTQKFTMTIPQDTSVHQVLESLKKSGIVIEVLGAATAEQEYRRQTVQLEAREMPGPKFFPSLLEVSGAKVQVESQRVVIRL